MTTVTLRLHMYAGNVVWLGGVDPRAATDLILQWSTGQLPHVTLHGSDGAGGRYQPEQIREIGVER